MEMRSEQVSRLRELGLSTCGARAYLALLELGEAKARGVSALARIPGTRVYKVLDQLRDSGLVEVTNGKPRSYAPIPLDDFIDRRVAEREEGLKTLRDRKAELGSLFPIRGTGTAPGRSTVLTISGRRNVLHRFGVECRRAERDVFVLSMPDAARAPLARHLEGAASRGVRVHVVREDMAALAGQQDVTIATFDARLALLVRLSMKEGDEDSPTAIGTTEPAFVGALRAILASRAPRRGRDSPVVVL